jgi:prepilin-type processing-associated H-X9-DG protein/prepilin-type N-terminal cleavage/methylation domain-containing protein
MKNSNLPPTGSAKPGAFTLIELLVVISIIALLLAILIPSLSKAKELANRIVCGAKIKNLATASNTYSSTGDGYFVPAGHVGWDQPAKVFGPLPPNEEGGKYQYQLGDRYWFQNETFRSYLEIDDYSISSNPLAMPKEFLCPSDKISKRKKETENRISYAYNNSDWRPWTLPYKIVGYKADAVRRPAETLNFVDSITHDVDLNGAHYKAVWDRVKDLYDPSRHPDDRVLYGSVYYRHNEGANVGFYDGHAQCLKKEIIFDKAGYYVDPVRTGMWTASGTMIPGWFRRWTEPEFR